LNNCAITSANIANKLLVPLLTWFKVIHFKPYTKEKFVENC